MAQASWYRLDNVGKFYSSEVGTGTQTVFRFSAVMDADVDPTILQRALDRAVARFPRFNVCLRSGFFWHYLEPAPEAPRVQPETLPICFGLHTGPKSVLFRVSYYRDRVNLEVSHMVSDGRGTLGFFKTLIGEYVAISTGQEAHPHEGAPSSEDTEDGFAKHYHRKRAGSTPTERAYRIAGFRDAGNPTYLEYHLPASRVHALAKGWEVSVTSLVIAAVICALRDTRPARDAGKPIRLTVPVDLRQFFETDTARNFFGLATVTSEGDPGESLESIAASVQQQIRDAVQPEQLEKRMNRMISLERNIFLRAAPLFLKDIVLDIATRIAARDITAAVSSLGRISFDEVTDEHVRSVNLFTSTFDLNFIVCTFGDDLSIGISTIFTNLEVVRTFCRIFSERSINGYINVNKDKHEISRDLRAAHVEEAVRQLGEMRKAGTHGRMR